MMEERPGRLLELKFDVRMNLLGVVRECKPGEY